jgi:maltooligosyltrehalose trehalohydrolase
LALVRELLTIRRRELVPHLAGVMFGTARCESNLVQADWSLGHGRRLFLRANLADQPRPLPRMPAGARMIWGRAAAIHAPWSVLWSVGGG